MAFEQTETQVHIPTAEGINLSATYHCAGDSQLGSVLICPAMGVTAKFYTPFARFLCDQGFHVLRIDYRGTLTEPMRVCPATMRSWAEVDIVAALIWIRQQLPANPIAAVGHSAGGQLAGISNSSVPVDALLMVASQSGHWRLWSGFKQVGMWLLWHVILPGLTNLCARSSWVRIFPGVLRFSGLSGVDQRSILRPTRSSQNAIPNTQALFSPSVFQMTILHPLLPLMNFFHSIQVQP